jgi:hypothetical protein
MTPPLFIEHAGVKRLAGSVSLATSLASRPRSQRVASGASEVEGEHVRDVEHAGIAAHGVVLLDLRAVVDRHVPAGEVDHARTSGKVGA